MLVQKRIIDWISLTTNYTERCKWHTRVHSLSSPKLVLHFSESPSKLDYTFITSFQALVNFIFQNLVIHSKPIFVFWKGGTAAILEIQFSNTKSTKFNSHFHMTKQLLKKIICKTIQISHLTHIFYQMLPKLSFSANDKLREITLQSNKSWLLINWISLNDNQ